MSNKKLALKRHHLEKLREVHEIIQQDPQQHATIDNLALTVGANRNLLVTGFREKYGTGIYQLQISLKLDKAKKLLLQTDKAVKDIAHLCGYKTVSGLRKAFKHEYGLSPSLFRKKELNGRGL